MSADETTRLRALLERATQTPWRQDGPEITVAGIGETVIAECTLPDCLEVADEDREEQEERNAALIVGAVNALPGLLDAAERAERAEARVRELEAIIAGRTTPPTDAEIGAHWRAGGTWVVEGVFVLRSADAARSHRDQTSWAAVPWVPVLHGRPCAWPTAEVSRG